MRSGDSDEYRRILNALYQMAGGGAAVDLGCGEAHVTKNWRKCRLIDLVLRPSVIEAGREIDQIDICLAPAMFASQHCRFDLCLMADSIEHLTKQEGDKVIVEMIKISNAVAIFTPVGPFCMDAKATHPDTHKSAWWPRDFYEAGWAVWEFPIYHSSELGAFWAWKFRDKTPSATEISERAGVSL